MKLKFLKVNSDTVGLWSKTLMHRSMPVVNLHQSNIWHGKFSSARLDAILTSKFRSPCRMLKRSEGGVRNGVHVKI